MLTGCNAISFFHYFTGQASRPLARETMPAAFLFSGIRNQ
jgi:hypothetical protein